MLFVNSAVCAGSGRRVPHTRRRGLDVAHGQVHRRRGRAPAGGASVQTELQLREEHGGSSVARGAPELRSSSCIQQQVEGAEASAAHQGACVRVCSVSHHSLAVKRAPRRICSALCCTDGAGGGAACETMASAFPQAQAGARSGDALASAHAPSAQQSRARSALAAGAAATGRIARNSCLEGGQRGCTAPGAALGGA